MLNTKKVIIFFGIYVNVLDLDTYVQLWKQK